VRARAGKRYRQAASVILYRDNKIARGDAATWYNSGRRREEEAREHKSSAAARQCEQAGAEMRCSEESAQMAVLTSGRGGVGGGSAYRCEARLYAFALNHVSVKMASSREVLSASA